MAKNRMLQGVLAAVVGSVLALLLWWAGWFEGWESQSWDWRARLMAKPGKATEKINLILLDQESLEWADRENGLGWPWPREVYGAVVGFCKRNDVKALAFDALYTEPSMYGVEDDRSFGAAIADFGAVVSSIFLSRTTGSEREWPAAAPERSIRIEGVQQWLNGRDESIVFPRAVFPVAELAAGTAVFANVHLDPDPDSVYRQVKTLHIFDGKIVPSLGLAAYLAGTPGASLAIAPGTMSVDGRKVPLDGEADAILNFRGPSGTHRAFSAAVIIQDELRFRNGEPRTFPEAEVFRDSYVLFGMSAPGLFDLRPSPVSGVYPGVEIHATFLDNLLSGDFIRAVPTATVVVATLLTALLAGVGTSCVHGIFKSGAIYVAAFVVPIAGALFAYRIGFWLPLVVQEAGVAITLLGTGLLYYSTEGKQKLFIKRAFKHYLSPAVIEELIKDPERLKLGGERRELTIFFSDLEGFTGISERLEPEALAVFLNEYLTAMTDIIQQEGGTVDKYEGDAIIAFWNAPLPQADHPSRCVRAALRCRDKVAEMRPVVRQRIGMELRMRIGINTGPAVVGNFGSHTRFNYTILGDAVNLAARLEGVNKLFGTSILISEATLKGVGGAYPVREISRVAVVGRHDPVRIYEPFLPEQSAGREAELQLFATGVAAFYRGEFTEAEGIFACLAGDPAAAAYREKCRTFIARSPENWHGVWVVGSK